MGGGVAPSAQRNTVQNVESPAGIDPFAKYMVRVEPTLEATGGALFPALDLDRL